MTQQATRVFDTAALAEVGFGQDSGGSQPLRSLAWVSPEEWGIDLNDPQQRRFGNYELIELLGKGGMGAVYLARQQDLDREVAIKFLSAGPWASDEFIARFRREAQAAARMQHPNIVEVYETGESDGLYFFSMRLVRGRTLAEVVAREGSFEFRRAATLTRTIAEAIDYAHRLGVLHLDLKPGNVLLAEDGTPLVADFGLARRVDEGPPGEQEQISGTPSYMAPEQALARTRIGPAADIHGLGALLYELLVGAPPYRGSSALDTLRMLVEEAVPAPGGKRPGLPRDLEAICLRCLQKDPAERYGSARELADDLGRFLAGEPVSVRRPGWVERGRRWIARNRLATAAGLILVAGVLGTTQQMLRAEAALLQVEQQRIRSERMVALFAQAFPSPDSRPEQGLSEAERTADRVVSWLRTQLHGQEAEQQAVLNDLIDALDQADNPGAGYVLLRPVIQLLGEDFRLRAAEAQIARGDARGKILGAALLQQPSLSDPAVRQRQLQLLIEAIDMAPEDIDVMAAATYFCEQFATATQAEGDQPQAPVAVCVDRRPALKLTEIEADNVANWLLALNPADPPQLNIERLHRAAAAPRIDDHVDRMLGLQLEAIRSAGMPLPGLLRGAAEKLGPKTSPEEVIANYMTWEMPIPGWGPLAQACDPLTPVADSAEVRTTCLAVGRRLAWEQRSLVASLVGSAIVRHMAPGTKEEQRAREIRRSYLYTFDAIAKRNPEQIRLSAEERYYADSLRHGELEAAKRMLDRAGIPRDPPADWLPEDPTQLMTKLERDTYQRRAADLRNEPMLRPAAARS